MRCEHTVVLPLLVLVFPFSTEAALAAAALAVRLLTHITPVANDELIRSYSTQYLMSKQEMIK